MKYFTPYIYIFFLAFMLLNITNSLAQIPRTMSYQGVLTDDLGTPLSDGNLSITFKLYDVSENGEALWTETKDVTLNSGIFNVILGSETDLDLPFDRPYWLGITVGEEDEMSPRTVLTSAPYSLNSTASVLEPENGQSFVVRDGNGNAVHTLSANGNSEHAGMATFNGGLQIKFGADSSIVMEQNGDYLFFGPSSVPAPAEPEKESGSANSSAPPIPRTRLRVTDIATPQLTSNRVASESNGGITAVEGTNTQFGNGVEGTSQNGNGVFGEGKGSGRGVSAISRGEGEAIIATAHGIGDAIVGTALSSGVGVTGFSSNSNGGHFTSQNGVGLYAKGSEKAAVLDGDVDVKGKLKIENVEADPNQERILVWSSDMIVRHRTLPSLSGDDDWLIDSEAGLISTGYDVVIKDSAGNITTRFDKDGTSLHTGVETFTNDVILKGTGDKGIKLVDVDGKTIAGFGREDLDTGQRIGVFGKAENAGDLAGVFEGDVDVLGEIVASSLHIVNTNGDSLVDFFADGTSRHKGAETYEDDVILKGTGGKGIKLIDPNGKTIAGFGREDLDTGQRIGVFGKAENEGDLAGVFEGDVDVLGEIVASSLHIVNTNGDSLTDFFADGTSRHRGLETYEAGIKIANTDGSAAIELVPNTDPNTEYGIKVNGNVMVNGIVNTGVLQAEVKQFRIDHPLDPENKYLHHASIESSEMKNVYDGSIRLDKNGEAIVNLPEWFQALNVDYRYQLTCVGGYAPVYVAKEIEDNQFKIAGGQEGLKVCWQVTGIRNDKWAQQNPLPIVTDKY